VTLDAKGRRERGLRVYERMGWGTNPDLKNLDEELWRLTTDFVFGEVWSRPGLSLREREIAVLAALIALGTEGMDIHLRHAHKLGITEDQIKELIFQVMYYVGQPRGLFAMKRLKGVMAETRKRRARSRKPR
jgi:4-carboxymuconolactone decarboxylase